MLLLLLLLSFSSPAIFVARLFKLGKRSFIRLSMIVRNKQVMKFDLNFSIEMERNFLESLHTFIPSQSNKRIAYLESLAILPYFSEKAS